MVWDAQSVFKSFVCIVCVAKMARQEIVAPVREFDARLTVKYRCHNNVHSCIVSLSAS